MPKHIGSAVDEQSLVSNDLDRNISRIVATSDQCTHIVADISQQASQLTTLLHGLQDLINRFKVE